MWPACIAYKLTARESSKRPIYDSFCTLLNVVVNYPSRPSAISAEVIIIWKLLQIVMEPAASKLCGLWTQPNPSVAIKPQKPSSR